MMIDTTTSGGNSPRLTGSRKRVAAVEQEPLLVTTPPPSYADDYHRSPSSGFVDADDDTLVYKDHPTKQHAVRGVSSCLVDRIPCWHHHSSC